MIIRRIESVPEGTLRRLSVLTTLTSLAMALATVWLGERAEQAGFLPVSFYVANAQRPILVSTMAVYAILGGVLTYRLPRLAYGWMWGWLAFTLLYIEFGRWYTAYGLFVADGAMPLLDAISWLTVSAWCATLALTSFILLLFPAGSLPSRRWRPFAAIIVCLGLATFLSTAFVPGIMQIVPYRNPYAWLPSAWVDRAQWLGARASIALTMCVLIAAISVFLRLRRARGVERQQVKWFAYAGLVMALLFGLQLVPKRMVNLSQYWEDILGALTFLFLALAMVIALLRYRLYDIDLIIRRTISYAIVTALLATIYLGVVIVLQGLLVELTGQVSQVAIMLSTLAIAALFNPLRLRVQETIDRRFFRRKYDADLVLHSFATAIRDETDIEPLARELARVVREAMQPTDVQVWLRPSVRRELGE